MAVSESLKNLCLDVIYDHAKSNLAYSSKNGKEVIDHRSQRSLQLLCYQITKVFELWSLPPNIIERVRHQNRDTDWEIRIQDIQNQDSTTITLCLQSSAEFERFKAFLRHLAFNWSQDIKVLKLYDRQLAFVVTYPVPALLCFYPRDHQDSRKHSARFPVAKASDIETVSKIITGLLAKDFCFSSVLKEVEKQSSNIAEKREPDEMLRNQSPDYSELFRGSENEIFTAGVHHYDASSAKILDQLKRAYDTALNQTSQSEFEAHIESSSRSLQSRSSQNEPEENLPSRPRRQAVKTRAAKLSRKDTQTDLGYEKLKMENATMKKTVETLSYEREAQMMQIDQLIDENKKIVELIEKKEAEMKETMLELGRASVELARYQNEKKRNELFIKTYKSRAMSTQTTELPPTIAGAGVSTDQEASTSIEARRTEAAVNISEVEGPQSVPFQMSIQESLSDTGSLTNMPSTGADGSMYNNYKYLLLRIGHGLLKDEVAKLNQWAQREFGIDPSGDVNDIFMELDRKKVISVTDLSRLNAYFENTFRIDFVCLIESYLRGDYGQLKNNIPVRRLGSSSRGLSRTHNGLTDQQSRPARGLSRSSSTEVGRSTGIAQDPAVVLHDAVTTLQRNFQRSRFTETQAGRTFGNSEGISCSTQHSTKRPDVQNGPESQGASSRKPFPMAVQRTSFLSGRGKETARNVSSSQGVVVLDGGRSEESEAPRGTVQARASSSTVRTDRTNTSRNADSGSNGLKLSKFQQTDASGDSSTQERGNRTYDGDHDDQWLCSHYKRRCYVQFECCNKFWPCHRCHNNHSSCGRKKLKSRDTKRIKCVACDEEQQFAQYCSKCNAKFAKYFCGLCKHLTGTDDNPYHCEKCGICRIHGDRSFHCDICGVCLDVQLRGNHKCREGSAHDECCICLEDAFTGCQILPCSHKVHKDCATQMIQSGITRCPICRESFAHKLERRAPSKKPPGK